VNTVTPGALKKIVTAAIWQADPGQAQADAEAAAKERGVFVTQSDPDDDHGTKRIWVRAATDDVIRFDATINDLAEALKLLGDTATLDARRAKAIGWIADPEAAHNLLQVARYLARHHTHAQPAHTAQPTPPTPPTPPPHRGNPPDPAADPDCGATVEDEPIGADEASAYAETTRADGPTPDDEAMAYDDVVADDAVAGDADGADDTRGVGDLNPASDGEGFTRLALAGTLEARLAAIKQDAYGNGLGAGSGRRGRHTVYVHLTDKTLATGTGVLRVEEVGPLLASQLRELLGHDQVIVKPVIDLHDQISVHAYEIPDRIRERVRLRHPVDMFPYGTAEAGSRMDLDHITPYDRTGPPGPPDQPGQTSTDNLIPQGRLHHRAKTFGGWSNQRLPNGAIEWTSPHGFRFEVDHTGTHPLPHRKPGDR
jgi:hypothetical protein